MAIIPLVFSDLAWPMRRIRNVECPIGDLYSKGQSIQHKVLDYAGQPPGVGVESVGSHSLGSGAVLKIKSSGATENVLGTI